MDLLKILQQIQNMYPDILNSGEYSITSTSDDIFINFNGILRIVYNKNSQLYSFDSLDPSVNYHKRLLKDLNSVFNS